MADFSLLNVQALAEIGSTMVICYPASKTPILDGEGKPSSLLIRGPNSPVAIELLRNNERMQMSGPMSPAEEEAAGVNFAVGLVISCNNVMWNGKPAEPKDLVELFTKHKFIVSQITRHFANGDNFLPKTLQG